MRNATQNFQKKGLIIGKQGSFVSEFCKSFAILIHRNSCTSNMLMY